MKTKALLLTLLVATIASAHAPDNKSTDSDTRGKGKTARQNWEEKKKEVEKSQEFWVGKDCTDLYSANHQAAHSTTMIPSYRVARQRNEGRTQFYISKETQGKDPAKQNGIGPEITFFQSAKPDDGETTKSWSGPAEHLLGDFPANPVKFRYEETKERGNRITMVTGPQASKNTLQLEVPGEIYNIESIDSRGNELFMSVLVRKGLPTQYKVWSSCGNGFGEAAHSSWRFLDEKPMPKLSAGLDSTKPRPSKPTVDDDFTRTDIYKQRIHFLKTLIPEIEE